MAAQAIGLGLGGLGQILSAFGIGNNSEQWKQQAMMALWNRAQQGDADARAMFESFAGPARQSALNTSNALERPTIDLAPFLMQYGQEALSGVNPTIQNYLSQTGGIGSGQNENLSGIYNGLGRTGEVAQQGFLGGGWTPQAQDLFDMLTPMMQGRGSNSQLALNDVGSNLIGQRGQTAQTQALQDMGIRAGQTGGMNPTLDYAMQRAMDTLSTGGYNDTSQGLADRGLGAIDAAFGRALGTPLMDPKEAANWAREDAYSQGENARERFYDSISGMGGGPATLGSGLQNQKKMDFADQIQQNASKAAREAFLAQQGLQLQDRSNASGLVGIGGQLASSGEQAATNRSGQAFGAIPGTQNAATGAMSSLLEAALGGGNLENARMQTGNSMSQNFINSILGAAGQSSNTLGNQNQYALGLGNLSNQAAGQQAGISNSMVQNQLNAMGMGNQLAQTSLQGSNQALGQLGNNWNNIAGQMSANNNLLGNMAGQALGYAGQNVGLMGSALGGMNYQGQPTPWAGVGQGIGGIINSIWGGR